MPVKSKADNFTPWIKPVTTVAGIWAGWRFVVKPILEGLGLKDTDAELESQKLQDQVENYSIDKNYWSPRFYQSPPSGTVAMILTYQNSNELAKSLDDAQGFWNDRESQIYAVFRSLKYKTQVSYLAYWFNRLYNKDLYNWLKGDVLNDDELRVVLKMTEQLPNGFKNNVTGKISGKTNSYQYFENIVDAVSNGDTKWARSLYKSLSTSQRNSFWSWYETTDFYEAQDQGEEDYVDQLRSILEPGIGKTGSLKVSKHNRMKVDGTEYKSVQITSGKTIFEFLEVRGKHNYVTIRKISNNPFGTIGKEYKNWDDAMQSYKNPTVKNMILLAENEIKNI